MFTRTSRHAIVPSLFLVLAACDGGDADEKLKATKGEAAKESNIVIAAQNVSVDLKGRCWLYAILTADFGVSKY
jgi:hypothetical protein